MITAPRRRRLLRVPRLSVRGVAIGVLIVVLLGCGWLWFRSSSLVAIKQVRVTGLTGPDVPQIRHDLTSEAKLMTTLDVSVARLQAAVSEYPDVKSVQVSTGFPHAITIHVLEEVPVATVQVGGRAVVVDSDGNLIGHPAGAPAPLPDVPLRTAPDGSRVTATGARAAIAILAAAPYDVLTHIQSATSSAAHGVIVQLRDGPQIYFGSVTQVSQKWTSALGVLSESSAAGADYIDVTDPRVAAAGAG